MNTDEVIETAQQFAQKVRQLQRTVVELEYLCKQAEAAARYYARAESLRGLGLRRLLTVEELREEASLDLKRVIDEARREIATAQELTAWLPREHSDLARAARDGEAVAPVE